MTNIESYIAFIPLIPLMGAAVNGLFGHRLPRWMVNTLGCTTIFLAFMIAVAAFVSLVQLKAAGTADPKITSTLYTWISSGGLNVDISFTVDSLSAIMALTVTGVGFLIHIYSIGYMAHDPAVARYFAYLNLFSFAMLVLVLGDSLPLMFVGWEGVGLCSYLLIGFWYTDLDKAVAGKKAFVTNRIGDFGFLVAMLILFRVTGTLTFEGVEAAATGGTISVYVATAVCLMLFLGATGKSAQLPLFVWLPDAMAGPTPVSALIHAATMVTAGVYMVARMGFLYSMAPIAMLTVAAIGAITALFAATIGTAQNDIKKVLAYSTVSQLGFMFVAAGLGAYAVAVFHLVTHAFFKACLFLGSGSVIHGMSGEQDIRQMGGLLRKQPITAVTFIIATLAITGVPLPFLAGFVSKDAILWSAWSANIEGAAYASVFAGSAKIIWGLAAVAAVFTAFYMWRMVFLTFWSGDTRAPEEIKSHIHESPFTMWMPLVVLAGLSIVAGLLNWPHLFHLFPHDWLAHWLQPVVGKVPTPEGHFTAIEWILVAVVTGAAVLAFVVAWRLYFKGVHPITHTIVTENPFRWVYLRLVNKWHVDELYEATTIQPLWFGSKVGLYQFVDKRVIDGTVNLVGWVGRSVGFLGQLFHSGNIQRYLAIFVIGLWVLMMAYFLPMGRVDPNPEPPQPTAAVQPAGGGR